MYHRGKLSEQQILHWKCTLHDRQQLTILQDLHIDLLPLISRTLCIPLSRGGIVVIGIGNKCQKHEFTIQSTN